MAVRVKRASSIGFCLGVRRAIDTITGVARERSGVETLGALVHNEQVLGKLAAMGVSTVDDTSQVRGDTLVISAHGVGPRVMDEIKARGLSVIDTTCPFVKRAQVAARRLAQDGFYTVVFGDAEHPEVKGILGWAEGQGMATTSVGDLAKLGELPRRLGLVSQTTQIPAAFSRFVKDVIDLALVRDAEIRIIDTVCHDIRRRQADTLKTARASDLMLVIGGQQSANTKHLFELCSAETETRLVETAAEIDPAWLAGKKSIGITAGASTDDETIDEVISRLEDLSGRRS